MLFDLYFLPAAGGKFLDVLRPPGSAGVVPTLRCSRSRRDLRSAASRRCANGPLKKSFRSRQRQHRGVARAASRALACEAEARARRLPRAPPLNHPFNAPPRVQERPSKAARCTAAAAMLEVLFGQPAEELPEHRRLAAAGRSERAGRAMRRGSLAGGRWRARVVTSEHTLRDGRLPVRRRGAGWT